MFDKNTFSNFKRKFSAMKDPYHIISYVCKICVFTLVFAYIPGYNLLQTTKRANIFCYLHKTKLCNKVT